MCASSEFPVVLITFTHSKFVYLFFVSTKLLKSDPVNGTLNIKTIKNILDIQLVQENTIFI